VQIAVPYEAQFALSVHEPVAEFKKQARQPLNLQQKSISAIQVNKQHKL
jgi:hypothetical protein